MFWLSFCYLFSFGEAHNLYVQYTSRRPMISKVASLEYVQYSSRFQLSRKLNTKLYV